MSEPLEKRLDDLARAIAGEIKTQRLEIGELTQANQEQAQTINDMRATNSEVLARIIPTLAAANTLIINNSIAPE
jgi:hypothetical protein